MNNDKPGDLDRLLTIREAATALGLKPWTLRKWVRTGRVPSLRLGRNLRIKRSVLANILETGTPGRP